MTRNTKKKLAIFVGTSKCLIYAEAKYCASDMPGEIKYYECSKTEYCCAFGCCVSPGLHFHHLWYYWILVIIIFLVCSGGGWWYRYWLQGRYRASASAIPTRSSNSRPQTSLHGPTCQAQQARISYNAARNTVLLHRPQRNGATPTYNGNATTSTHYQNMNVVLNDANCPYYQLYGPPPSYETVIAQSRGKVHSPVSPDSSAARLNLQSANSTSNPGVAQCFSYTCNPSANLDDTQRTNDTGNSNQQLDNNEGIPFAHYSQYCATGPTLRQNVCIPFEYQEESIVTTDDFGCAYQGSPKSYVPYSVDKSSDTSDADNAAQNYEVSKGERYTMLDIDCGAGSSREQCSWEPKDHNISLVHGKSDRGKIDKGRTVVDRQREQEATAEIMDSPSASGNEENDKHNLNSALSIARRDFMKDRRVLGGSLKATGRYTGKTRCEEYSVQRVPSKSSLRFREGGFISGRATASENASRNVSPSEYSANANVCPLQSNPSNNVILLRSFVLDGKPSLAETCENEDRRPRPTNGSTNSDLESKHRLDRSKSLD
ncbi:hypothetical protein KM043_011567 [Ampulex compressa]|nr:hypothetical protein KM043_011567 [Ampulex compressa]